jgi:hypothetical protein
MSYYKIYYSSEDNKNLCSEFVQAEIRNYFVNISASFAVFFITQVIKILIRKLVVFQRFPTVTHELLSKFGKNFF